MLGLVGSALSGLQDAAKLLAYASLALACLELAGLRPTGLQRDRETPYSWVGKGPLRWAAINGVALGVGWSSRIGFWAWYVVPALALWVANPAVGAVIYGSYALSRTLAAPVLLWSSRRHPQWDLVQAMLGRKQRARALSSLLLVYLASGTLVAVEWQWT